MRADNLDLIGTWTAELATGHLLTLEILVRDTADDSLRFQISTAGTVEGTAAEEIAVEEITVEEIITGPPENRFHLQSRQFPRAGRSSPLVIDGSVSADRRYLDLFVNSGAKLTQLSLPRRGAWEDSTWQGTWNALGDTASTRSIELYLDEEDGQLGGYLFFRDADLPSLWTYGLQRQSDGIEFHEKNLGMRFEGRLETDRDVLRMLATSVAGSSAVTFRRVSREVWNHASRYEAGGDLAEVVLPGPPATARYTEHAPEAVLDGWKTGAPASVGIDSRFLQDLVAAVSSRELTHTHGILVARRGTLVFEEYFYGYGRDTRHDLRSASKTITSALVGTAIDRGYLAGVEVRVLDFFPGSPQREHWDPHKADIKLRHLLTMSSGLDADDSSEGSVASEDNYQSQTERPDWSRLVLDAPMLHEPGEHPLYGTANPMLISGILEASLTESVAEFAHRSLWRPLGVSGYQWFLDPTGRLYLGGGLHLRPRDMAKFGQLYLEGGLWNGERVLSQAWVTESTTKHGRLENTRDRNEYGYLWWHQTYDVNGRRFDSIEARGNGGQYIFVVPSEDLVVVVTSGNYRNGRSSQPEEIMERFILPALR